MAFTWVHLVITIFPTGLEGSTSAWRICIWTESSSKKVISLHPPESYQTVQIQTRMFQLQPSHSWVEEQQHSSIKENRSAFRRHYYPVKTKHHIKWKSSDLCIILVSLLIYKFYFTFTVRVSVCQIPCLVPDNPSTRTFSPPLTRRKHSQCIFRLLNAKNCWWKSKTHRTGHWPMSLVTLYVPFAKIQ